MSVLQVISWMSPNKCDGVKLIGHLNVTENGYLGFLVQEKEWKLYNVFPILHGVPTAILVYARVLLLGLDSGNYFYFA